MCLPKIKLAFSFFFLFLLPIIAFSQPYFYRSDSIKVKIDGAYIANPWAGGLNFAQISNVDLDLDGIKDLFVFDRTGNKVRTFINEGIPNQVSYRHAPEYEGKFPVMHDWALMADYNCDGKEDIFTYSSGGFALYKNTSDINNGLQFTLITPLQYSVYNPPNGMPINLYISATDVPAISDIDNDGDLDIVTFTIIGTYIEYHQNQSMELFGTCDSLVFRIKNSCWGYTAENAVNFNYTLYDTCFGNVSDPGIIANYNDERSVDRHSGSCLLCMDLDGDGDKDLVTGDVSFSTLTAQTNGGNDTAASMVFADPDFPANNSNTAALNLDIFPCGYYVDVNNDQVRDLIVSPNAPNASENFNSMVYYKNVGLDNAPDFQFQQRNLLQDSMIEVGEGAYPSFFDYNNDGLTDLFVGNFGYYNSTGYVHSIALFKNIGTTTQPEFELVTRDYGNYSTLGISNMVPAFGDLDGDGDGDMLIGAFDGKLHYFQNNGFVGDTADFSLVQANFRNSNTRVIDVGDYAAPQIVDVDGDGKNDIVIGGRNGKIAYYHQIGNGTSSPPMMDSVTHYWGNIQVHEFGYVTGYTYPMLFKQGGVTKLLTGSEKGYLNMFDNIDGNLNGAFNKVDSTYLGIMEGARTAPAGKDLNADGLLDMIIGNYSGGIAFYKGTSTIISGIEKLSTPILWDADLFPNPANQSFSLRMKDNSSENLYRVELYSIIGQQLLSESFNGTQYTLSTDALASGIYVCKISKNSNGGVLQKNMIVKRIVVQH